MPKRSGKSSILRAPNYFKFAYDDKATLWEKMNTIATHVWRPEITADARIRTQASYGMPATAITQSAWRRRGIRSRPMRVCAARRMGTWSASVRSAAAAQFVVMICGDIMTMPGLPRVPAANSIDVDDAGRIVGLF